MLTNKEKYQAKLSLDNINVEHLKVADRLMKRQQFYTLNRMYRNLNLETRREVSRCTGFKPFKLYTRISIEQYLERINKL